MNKKFFGFLAIQRYLLILLVPALLTGAAGTSKPEQNPLLMKWDTPHGTPPFNLIKTKHFVPALEIALKEAKKEVDAIINNKKAPTFNNTVLALELNGKKLDRIDSVMMSLNEAHTSKELQQAVMTILPKLTKFSNYVSLHPKLFERVKAVYSNREQLKLRPEQKKILNNSYKGFVRNGANLKGEAKKEYQKITTELSKLSQIFSKNVLEATNSYSLHIEDKKDLAGLPESVIEAAAYLAKSKKKTGWMFNLQYPSFYPFIKYADNRKLRKDILIAYGSRSNKNDKNDNKKNVKRITELRLKLANLLGYKSYAHYILEERMALSTEKVNNFLNDLHNASLPFAKKELDELKAFAKKNKFEGTFQSWDQGYYSAKLKAEKYGFNEEEIRPYFEIKSVKKGIFELVNKLFGLTFKKNNKIQVYHKDVDAVEVYSKDNTFIGVLYMDFFPRESKGSGAWSGGFRTQSNVNGKFIHPLRTIVCNFTKPTETKPSLLSLEEASLFLHEFGHALHGLLSNTEYESLAGTKVLRDFVELPSQLLENWLLEKEWLDTFVKHYKTGKKIPEALLKKLLKSKNYQAGTKSEGQLRYGMLDMAWHSIEKPVTESAKDFELKVTKKTRLLPSIKETMISTALLHIFASGYASGYYSYKWAEVLDADAFSMFKKNGIFDQKTANSFRKNILEKGGTEHPMKLYKRFRGQEPTIDALLKRSGLIKKK